MTLTLNQGAKVWARSFSSCCRVSLPIGSISRQQATERNLYYAKYNKVERSNFELQ
jgi:hypothetical protein